MLDVHPPHKAIHGTGEFFLHLFTITVGLLIAVGIEGAVERHEHHRLSEDARETMTAEIRRNLANTNDLLQNVEEQQKRMRGNLAMLEKIQLNPSGPEADNANIDASFGSVGLESTAWRTAQATGALSYMPYEQAKRFSEIYTQAQGLESAQDVVAEDEAQLLGVLRRYPMLHGRMSKDAADAMAQRFGIWQGHLLSIHVAARVLQEEEKAFLEGREPKHQLSEKLGD
jgi:hypothetical protein